MTTLGTFNTLDGKGTVTDFADVILLTEAISAKVRRELGGRYDIYACRFQRDLMIAITKAKSQKQVRTHYRLVHPGIAKVTPHRGEFWLTLLLDGEPTAIQVGHWINAAFPPYRRGEARFRRAMWRRHQRISLRIIRRHIRKGRTVMAGGDLNSVAGVKGYAGVLNEVGRGFDRLGSTRQLAEVQTLSRMGSDHHRLKATVR